MEGRGVWVWWAVNTKNEIRYHKDDLTILVSLRQKVGISHSFKFNINDKCMLTPRLFSSKK